MSDLNMPIASLSRITGGKYNIEPDISSKIKTTKKKEITKEMQEVIDRLERNDMSPIQPPFHIKDTDINIMNAYEKIFMSNIK
jgi:23S rRNA A1618 N6-methylase RlmF